MAVNEEAFHKISKLVADNNATLVAVSKTKPVEDILQLYNLGQRDFGENYVQELVDKQAQLPQDIRWHFIGHLQSNKVKYITSFVHLIHGVDTFKLLSEINKQAAKAERNIKCLLQIHIAKESTKFGLDEKELNGIMQQDQLSSLNNVSVLGLMGMASFTDDTSEIISEFQFLNILYKRFPQFTTLSMGMSSDFKIALDNGSNMVRIGSLLFGSR